MTAVPWRAATQAALYGPGGFFVSGTGVPAAHFRTSVHVSGLLARGVRTIAAASGLPTVVDVGAGGGELLSALRALDPGLVLAGVDLAPRPPGLDPSVLWVDDVVALDALLDAGAVVVANEWLDDVPVDVVEVVDGEPRLVLVEPASGVESSGPAVSGRDRQWLATWWRLGEDGARAEPGWPRDDAWASVVSRLGRGIAVAVDYGHLLDSRPRFGSLAGYRDGRQVEPVPDGSCDVTAAVALDAVAAAGVAAGAEWSVLTTQRAALSALVEAPGRPSYEDAQRDPREALAALALAGEWAELVDRGGLGAFGWLVQGVGLPLPPWLEGVATYPGDA